MAAEREQMKELGKEGLLCGQEDVSYRKKDNYGVVLAGRQHRKSAFPEGSTFMPSDDDAGAMFILLTEQERKVILDSIKSLLSARQLTSVPPASTGP